MENRITVAESLLIELERIGVDTIFGIISIHNIPFFDALERRGTIRIVSGRHEGAAVNMADAYSRISGKLGVVLTSTGTGAGNAAGALIESWNGGAPLLHITGQVASPYVETGRGYIHDSKDQLRMLDAAGKSAYRVRRPEQAPSVFRRAITEALAPPSGPVSVELPIDFQAALIDPPSFISGISKPAAPSDADLAPVIDKLLMAQRPVLWVGGGAMLTDCSDEVKELMETIDAAVITSQSARGIVPETDSRCLGHFATFPPLKDFVAKSDLLISIGVRFRGNETSNWSLRTPAEHIAIDADPMGINRNFPVSIGVTGEAKPILAAILRLATARRPKPKLEYREEVAQVRSVLRQQLRDTLGPWEEILDAIRKAIPEDAILARDVTVPATVWGARLIERRHPRSSVHAAAGGIGQGLPMAIGAQIAAPQRKVILLAGDGGFLLNIGELAVAHHENLPIVIILFDDNGYGVLRDIQKVNFDGRTAGVDMHSPDFVEVARAFRFRSGRAKTPGEFATLFAEAVASSEPWMVVLDSASIGPMKKIFAGPDGGSQLYKPH